MNTTKITHQKSNPAQRFLKSICAIGVISSAQGAIVRYDLNVELYDGYQFDSTTQIVDYKAEESNGSFYATNGTVGVLLSEFFSSNGQPGFGSLIVGDYFPLHIPASGYDNAYDGTPDLDLNTPTVFNGLSGWTNGNGVKSWSHITGKYDGLGNVTTTVNYVVYDDDPSNPIPDHFGNIEAFANIPASNIPEPTSLALLALGGLSILSCRHRNRAL